MFVSSMCNDLGIDAAVEGVVPEGAVLPGDRELEAASAMLGHFRAMTHGASKAVAILVLTSEELRRVGVAIEETKGDLGEEYSTRQARVAVEKINHIIAGRR
jgi:hypothetical protein